VTVPRDERADVRMGLLRSPEPLITRARGVHVRAQARWIPRSPEHSEVDGGLLGEARQPRPLCDSRLNHRIRKGALNSGRVTMCSTRAIVSSLGVSIAKHVTSSEVRNPSSVGPR
jgi:hypothetical protein